MVFINTVRNIVEGIAPSTIYSATAILKIILFSYFINQARHFI
nr:MAG TPA: hypothetical protein [Caudoviricetes sp.]